MTVLMQPSGKHVDITRGVRYPTRRIALLVDSVPDPGQARMLGPVATLLRDPGTAVARIRFDSPAATLADAVTAGVRAVEAAGMRVTRVDVDDWVTAADIGYRVGRSRETVRLWAAGRMGPGGFPPPANPRRGTTFYSWAELLPWLRTRMGLNLPEEEPALVAANLSVQLRALLPRLSCPGAVLDLLGQPA